MSTDAPTDDQGAPEARPTGETAADQAVAGQSGSTAPAGGEAEPASATEAAASIASASEETAGEAAPADDPATHRFECRSCGFVYDPDEGVRKLGIDPGTSFLDLDPVGFRCPVCRSRVGAFRDIGPRSKPSGFEENLDFGLGVNRLTPGQKNVLIFGGFALAFAFFLSLYSLR
jgi:rubredoxin